jgi:hypothetical protein
MFGRTMVTERSGIPLKDKNSGRHATEDDSDWTRHLVEKPALRSIGTARPNRRAIKRTHDQR